MRSPAKSVLACSIRKAPSNLVSNRRFEGGIQNQPNMPTPQGQSLDQQIAADRARLSELVRNSRSSDNGRKSWRIEPAIQQKEADRRDRLNVEIATRGAQGELARLLGPETQAPPTPSGGARPQSLSDLLNRPLNLPPCLPPVPENGVVERPIPAEPELVGYRVIPSATTETPAPPKSGWARFGNETGTLNIPRAEMPQVKAEHRGGLGEFPECAREWRTRPIPKSIRRR